MKRNLVALFVIVFVLICLVLVTGCQDVPKPVTPTPITTGTTQIPKSVVFSSPKSNETMKFSKDANGIYTCSISGMSSGVVQSNTQLLLWVQPVQPRSETPGWYLQRPPNGIQTIVADGSWTGTAQLGNLQWPPHTGDLFDVTVTIVDDATASELMKLPGVVVRIKPIGQPFDTATGVIAKV